jgi:hypothetical protein
VEDEALDDHGKFLFIRYFCHDRNFRQNELAVKGQFAAASSPGLNWTGAADLTGARSINRFGMIEVSDREHAVVDWTRLRLNPVHFLWEGWIGRFATCMIVSGCEPLIWLGAPAARAVMSL